MLPDRLRALFRPGFSANAAPPTSGGAGATPDPLQLAACALLLDVAYADGEFTVVEREQLERALEQRFGLSPVTGREVIALAEEERTRAVDHFAFTSALRARYDTAQKVVLAETMWELVLADGRVAEHEHYLTRKIANLLELDPAHLSAAKQAAAERAASRQAGDTGEPGTTTP